MHADSALGRSIVWAVVRSAAGQSEVGEGVDEARIREGSVQARSTDAWAAERPGEAGQARSPGELVHLRQRRGNLGSLPPLELDRPALLSPCPTPC